MNDYGYLSVFSARANDLLTALGDHILITFASVFLGCLVAIPFGIFLTRTKIKQIRSVTFTITNVFNTIPSLAMLAMLLPILGVGMFPAIIALFLYSLMPILRNTYAGFTSIDPHIIESAKGMGYNTIQLLIQIELPLAFPYIMSGIRLTTVYIINWAVLATLIGAGGLGDLIVSGLGVYDKPLILSASVLSMILTLVVDFALSKFEKSLFQGVHSGQEQS